MQFVYQRTPAAWPLVAETEGVTGERVVVVKVIIFITDNVPCHPAGEGW